MASNVCKIVYPNDNFFLTQTVISYLNDRNSINEKYEKSSENDDLAKFYLPNEPNGIKGTDFAIACALCHQYPELRVLAYTPPSNFSVSEQFFRASVFNWKDKAILLQKYIKNNSNEYIEDILKPLNDHLISNTVLVGYQITLADLAVFIALFQHLNVFEKYPNIVRWYNFMLVNFPRTSIISLTRKFEVLENSKVNESSSNSQAKNKKKNDTDGGAATQHENNAKKTNKDKVMSKNVDHSQQEKKKKPPKKESNYNNRLECAVHGEVVTRFAPEPSGYLHIGHAKAVLLNNYYVKMYQGKLLVRFDDTNPARENMEFENAIKEDLKLLGVETNFYSHTSDYFDVLEKHCETLIRRGLAYLDDTPIERMREERTEGIKSQYRDATVEQNLIHWKQMEEGSPEGLKFCVRAKIDYESKNKCMRDPVIYRCITDIPHHIHGFKYKRYPTYDFACPIVDSLEGVTHAMRANEYSDRIPQYQWMINSCELKPVSIYEFSRLNFVNTLLSKRKLQWFVDKGIVESWDDPRMPTVRGMIRRGLKVEALLQFILEQGPSKNVNLMEWDKLWAINKQIIDPVIPRFMAVSASESVLVTLVNGPDKSFQKAISLHAKNPDVGTTLKHFSKTIHIDLDDAIGLNVGEEITLMHWCNAIVKKMNFANSKNLQSIIMELNPEGDFKKTKKKIHWVSRNDKTPTIILREYSNLITKKKLEEDDVLEKCCNINSRFDTYAVADSGIDVLNQGDFLQFERRGYFRYDKKATSVNLGVFVKIPDGKMKAMSVVKTQVDAAQLIKG